jgi:hypothetical protein
MIRVVFTASPSFVSRAIRWVSKGRVSHVFLQHPSETWGGEWATEATWPMVLQRPAERARHNIVKEFECTFGIKAGMHKCRNEVGKWYAFEGFFLIGWWLLLQRLLKRKIRHPFSSTKGDLCMELIIKIFKASPKLAEAAKELDPDYTTPEQLLQFCEKHPEAFNELVAAK